MISESIPMLNPQDQLKPPSDVVIKPGKVLPTIPAAPNQSPDVALPDLNDHYDGPASKEANPQLEIKFLETPESSCKSTKLRVSFGDEGEAPQSQSVAVSENAAAALKPLGSTRPKEETPASSTERFINWLSSWVKKIVVSSPDSSNHTSPSTEAATEETSPAKVTNIASNFIQTISSAVTRGADAVTELLGTRVNSEENQKAVPGEKSEGLFTRLTQGLSSMTQQLWNYTGAPALSLAKTVTGLVTDTASSFTQLVSSGLSSLWHSATSILPALASSSITNYISSTPIFSWASKNIFSPISEALTSTFKPFADGISSYFSADDKYFTQVPSPETKYADNFYQQHTESHDSSASWILSGSNAPASSSASSSPSRVERLTQQGVDHTVASLAAALGVPASQVTASMTAADIMRLVLPADTLRQLPNYAALVSFAEGQTGTSLGSAIEQLSTLGIQYDVRELVHAAFKGQTLTYVAGLIRENFANRNQARINIV
jgi:hypothetical protein